jgi:hypothetical protein
MSVIWVMIIYSVNFVCFLHDSLTTITVSTSPDFYILNIIKPTLQPY